jgi:2-C-methyl-D-erythritol 4-phosphate cytidylyltransferase
LKGYKVEQTGFYSTLHLFNFSTVLSAIIVAAGDSRRMGFDKLFAAIAGKPVVAHTLRAFERADSVDGIVVVAREDRHDEIKTIVRDENLKKVRSIISGGKRRQDSVRAGLDHLESTARYVAVHDAARPLITPTQIEHLFQRCQIHGAAALAEPINDTLKRADADLLVTDSVDRRELYAMQTPQMFERALIDEAYEAVYAENILATDEVSAVERLGRKVVLVVNDDFNFKITYPRDLPLAEFVLTRRREPIRN